MDKLKPVKIGSFTTDAHNYVCEGKQYPVKDLIEVSKKLPVFEIPLQGLYLGGNPWGNFTIQNFVFHMSRVNDADLSYPVILDTEGYVCDGWHRVSKAILEGKTTIKAVRLETMPEPYFKE